jgi:hypothetical protein
MFWLIDDRPAGVTLAARLPGFFVTKGVAMGKAFSDHGGQSFANVPARTVAAMRPGDITPWTPVRILAAFGTWLVEETAMPSPRQPAFIRNIHSR